MKTSLDAVFVFWFSGLLGGGWAQNDQKWRDILSVSLPTESYFTWLWFLVHMCKMISSAIFFRFSKFWFFKWKFWGVPYLLHICVIFEFHLNDIPTFFLISVYHLFIFCFIQSVIFKNRKMFSIKICLICWRMFNFSKNLTFGK